MIGCYNRVIHRPLKSHMMLPTQRREKILELLTEDGSAQVKQLARLFKVTEVTLQQDL